MPNLLIKGLVYKQAEDPSFQDAADHLGRAFEVLEKLHRKTRGKDQNVRFIKNIKERVYGMMVELLKAAHEK